MAHSSIWAVNSIRENFREAIGFSIINWIPQQHSPRIFKVMIFEFSVNFINLINFLTLICKLTLLLSKYFKINSPSDVDLEIFSKFENSDESECLLVNAFRTPLTNPPINPKLSIILLNSKNLISISKQNPKNNILTHIENRSLYTWHA